MATQQSPVDYAQAIFEQATQDWLGSLKQVMKCLPPADFQALDKPSLPMAQKQEMLQQAIPSNATQEVRNFLSLLASRGEMHFLPDIISRLEQYAAGASGRRTARVTSAIPLTDDEKRALETKMRKRFGEDTDFGYTVDREILGGVVVRVGDQVIDGSVAAKLAALKEKLK